MDHATRLALISQAWGKQRGYCFFPWIEGTAISREERIRAYHEGPAFKWPTDRRKIIEHLESHWDDDLYWCPSLFEYPRRRLELAMDECCLWADLDEVDPRSIEEYPPTMAWETSPERYQALWLIAPGFDIQGASWQGGENHRLTAYLGADPGGWDTTQLLRLPEWPNHKPEREGVIGKLLWGPRGHRRYLPDEFNELPEVPSDGLGQFVEEQIDQVDYHKVWSRVRLKVSAEVRHLVAVKEPDPSADRSNKLWQIARELADVGCTAPEIAAITRRTVWNKYEGRNDEDKRLLVEAVKAIQARPEGKTRELELEHMEYPTPIKLATALKNIKPPRWIVKEIWTEGGCGFIGGQPKSFKSWCALDLALSVATGAPFLGYEKFSVEQPGRVLYIQEEDSLPTIKGRYDKLWPSKQTDQVKINGDEVIWVPSSEMKEPDVDVVVRAGVTLSDPAWQSWLDETLEQGGYRMLVLDPLIQLTGGLDENKASEINSKVLRPLSEMSEKHNVAICIVHHMKKSNGNNSGSRGGQMMLGSAAYHAWAHDALYLTLEGKKVEVERENKETQLARFSIGKVQGSKTWNPTVSPLRDIYSDEPDVKTNGKGKHLAAGSNRVWGLLTSHEPGKWHTVGELQEAFEARTNQRITYPGIYNPLKRLEGDGTAFRRKMNGKTYWRITTNGT